MKMRKNLLYLSLIFILPILTSFNDRDKNNFSSEPIDHTSAPPHLQTINGVTRLIVDDEPYLVLGGELHNSSSSSLEYMNPIWPQLAQMNLNTILVPLSWELVEPKEGQFNFDLVDGLIEDARKNNLKIIFLWFGSWKNMVSTYVPEWVKKDPKRFPLYTTKNGEIFQMLSTFSEESRQADARAFAALMRHIKQVDAEENTVIMMQVENEVGTSGGERDYSKAATEAYENRVPERLMSYLQKNKSSLIPELKQVWAENGYKTKGSWSEVFGEGGVENEFFMAWQLASYIGEVTRVGKSEYNIPMFVNASVGRQDQKLGTYPSGGPVPLVMDIWRAAAPEVDMICPDIYHGDFTNHCEKYTQSGNPLFIPETRAGERGAANALLAYANFNAIGYSPFAIERKIQDPTEEGAIPQAYNVLDQLSHLILNSEAKKQMMAVSLDADEPSKTIELGKYEIQCDFKGGRSSNGDSDVGYAILIESKPDEFFVAGQNINLQFSLINGKGKATGILAAEEGKFEGNTWSPERRLNGDEIMVSYAFPELFQEGKSGNGLKFNGSLHIQHVKLYNY